MRRQHLADFVNRFGERVAEFFILKMNLHSIHNVSPELFAAFFMNRLVANNGEFVSPRRSFEISLPSRRRPLWACC